ncbi:MAG: P-type ATPase, partial [Isosphaeraceae bacterium]
MSLSRIVSGGFGGAVYRTLDCLRRPSGAGGFAGQSSPQARELHAAAQGKVSTLLKSLGTSLDGLSSDEVRRRQCKFGLNEVVYERPPRWHVQILRAFKNPFIALLGALGAVAFLTHELKTASIIEAMVLISVLLRFVQEYRSTHAAERLKARVRNTAMVTRSEVRRPGYGPRTWEAVRLLAQHGKREVPRRELVPGDIVHLSAGDMIPADVRVLTAKDLFVSQSALTGESLPVEKWPVVSDLPAAAKAALPELATICFMGTSVVSGTATAVVVATGGRTYFGSMAKSIVGRRQLTSFDKGVNSVSWLLIRFMLVMVPVVFVINGITKHDWLEAFLFGVAVAVGLTPEMLPMIVTANLAKGAVRMARRKTIVKRLNAIQNFGAMDILCTDKTGTL